MGKRLSREELYRLVWSEPMKTLAPRFGISDVALKKTCSKAHIPVPERGYWAKRAAGKRTVQADLPPRGPGESDEVVVGGGGYHWSHGISREEAVGLLPEKPSFAETMDTVRERVARQLRKVAAPATLSKTHPAVGKLLADDEKRREKQRASPFPMSWYAPKFESPLQRRRLRILNAIFLALAREYGAKAWTRGEEAEEIGVTIGHESVGLELKPPPAKGRSVETASRPKLRLAITGATASDKGLPAWQDDDAGPLEAKLTAACIEIIMAAEQRHRHGRLHHYEWLVERKARLEEEDRKQKAEAERKERERKAKLERERVEHLLSEAASLQKAKEIRAYVDAVRAAAGQVPSDTLEHWTGWALAQADRLDPIKSERFLGGLSLADPDEPV